MDIGRTLVVLGLVMVAAGVVFSLVGRLPLLGRLPGDVSFGGDGWRVYAPIGTSIVVSLALTVALSLFAWLARR